MQIQPYLQFNGRCQEAVNFYQNALGAQVLTLLHFKDVPDNSEITMPGDQVMHAGLRIGDSTLMATDGGFQEDEGFKGFSLTLDVADAAEAHQKFAALADGGQVQMPLSAHFFSSCFGVVTDRFGIAWNINVPLENHVFLTRVVDAPRDLVWKAFSDAKALAQWWGPKDCTTRVEKLDFRPGGVFLYAIQTPDGGQMWGKFVYRDIVPPERLVFMLSFADAEGNTTRAPFSATHPLEILSDVTFTEQDGKTTITMRSGPFNSTQEERESYAAMLTDMQEGTNATLDNLVVYLAKTQA